MEKASIDFDGVVVNNSQPISQELKRRGFQIEVWEANYTDAITKLATHYKLDFETAKGIYEKVESEFIYESLMNIPLVPGAAQNIAQLARDMKLFILTARHTKAGFHWMMRYLQEHDLVRYFQPEVYLDRNTPGGRLRKQEMIKREGIRAHIDDDTKHHLSLDEIALTHVRIALKQTHPHPLEHPHTEHGIYVASHWDEVTQELRRQKLIRPKDGKK